MMFNLAKYKVQAKKVGLLKKMLFLISNPIEKKSSNKPEAKKKPAASVPMGAREERRVPMTRLRAKIAERLLKHNITQPC